MSMFSSPDLLKSPPTKEDLKIHARREANEQRRVRLLDARRRVIGIDVEGLNQQVREKQQDTANRAEQDRLEKVKMHQIEAVLEAAANDEAEARELQKRELKKSWDNSVNFKNSRPVSPPLDPQLAGPSAVQVLQGEDRGYWARVDAQRQQQYNWIQESLAEKAYLKQMNSDDSTKFKEMQKRIDEMRELAERDEAEQRRMLNLSIKTDNDILVKIQQENKHKMNDPFDSKKTDLLGATSLNILTETPEDACDASGRILRRDMFKGYTESQKKRIWLENEKCRQQKLDILRQEMDNENEYIAQQSAINKAMETAAHEMKTLKDEMNKEHTQFLKNQAREQNALKDLSNKNKFGAIDSDFFGNFGKSCR